MMRTRSQSRQKKQRAENRLLAENNVPQESAQPSTPSTSPVFARPDAERRDSRNTKNASEAAKIRDDDIESNTYPSGVLSTRKNQPTFLPDPTSGDTSSSENFACEQQRLNVTFGHDAGAHLYNIQSWLTESCPSEVLYRVISFAGPQTVQALSRTCRKWRDVILDEGDVEDEDENGSSVLWKILCEDYGKWEPSSNLQPVVSWREHYQLNPLVPIDYTTITRALNSLRQLFRSSSESTLRILLRPGSYVLSHSLNIGSNRTIIFQTVPNALPWREGIDKIPLMRKLPSDAGTESGASMGLQGGVSPRRLRRLPGSGLLSPPVWREMLAGCRGKGGAGGTVNSFSEEATSRRRVVVLPQGSHPDPLALSALRRNRAVLSLRTGRQNEPTFRVQRGHLELRDLDIVHSCAGNDIWNGNSAVQIQPPMGQNGEVILRPGSYMPSAIVHNCGIRSISGRGIVVIDGGVSRVSDCFIHHCAATGIYVGGSGSRAEIERTDVVYNGRGNPMAPRNSGGVGRGHSGVYLEQGYARLSDCNVSENSLTGISAISHDNATLIVEGSELVANGTDQIEWPPFGTPSRTRCSERDNQMATTGRWKGRSSLVIAEVSSATTATSSEPRE